MEKVFTKIDIEDAEKVGLTLLKKGKNRSCRVYKFKDCGHVQQIYVETVRSLKVKCKQCNLDERKQNAKSLGLEYLGDGANHSLKSYRFMSCSHIQNIDYGSVKKQFKPTCFTCLNEKRNQQASDVGLELIGKGRNRNFGLYKCKKCNAEQQITFASIKRDSFICHNCLDNKHKKEATSVNLEIIKTISRHYKLYKFKKCGHEQKINISHVRKNNFKCHTCIQNTHIAEAEQNGLTIVGKGKNTKYRLYEFIECGHQQEIQLGNVRLGRFICNICEETHMDFPSNIYLLEISFNDFIWLKLGFSKNINKRILEYGLPKEAIIKQIKTIEVKTGRYAQKIEMEIHKKFKKFRLPKKDMSKLHSKQGFNECYNVCKLKEIGSHLDTLIVNRNNSVKLIKE